MSESLPTQLTYLKYSSGKLDRYKQLGPYLFNFRCPFCGDSQKSRTKARGYVFKTPKGMLGYRCHNCDASGFKNLLKHVDPVLYRNYLIECFRDETPILDVAVNQEDILKKKIEDAKCVNVAELSRLHPANEYLMSRGLSTKERSDFFYAENFATLCESLGRYDDVGPEPRLVQFETDSIGDIKLLVGRSISKKTKQRYITIRLVETYPKMIGLQTLDTNSRVYVVEGLFDRLTLPNCVATLDANLLGHVSHGITFKDAVYILDNEPRSSIIRNKLKKLINDGLTVVVHGTDIKHKDLSEMREAGIDVLQYVQARTFSGPRALLEFNKWVK